MTGCRQLRDASISVIREIRRRLGFGSAILSHKPQWRKDSKCHSALVTTWLYCFGGTCAASFRSPNARLIGVKIGGQVIIYEVSWRPVRRIYRQEKIGKYKCVFGPDARN